MNLAANASQKGYAMAALLVGMAVMAIMLSVAMPTWNQMIRREKEEELVFRGNQYARAINFYQRKFANASPANFDIRPRWQVMISNDTSGSRGIGHGHECASVHDRRPIHHGDRSKQSGELESWLVTHPSLGTQSRDRDSCGH